MKETITNEFLSAMLKFANSAGDFLKAEVPKYIEELLDYKAFEIGLSMFTFIFVMTVCVVLMVISYKIFIKSEEKNDEEGSFFSLKVGTISSIVFAVLLLIGICKIPQDISSIYKIKYAPRVFIIDYIRDTQSRSKL